jgi:hypothetical protein
MRKTVLLVSCSVSPSQFVSSSKNLTSKIKMSSGTTFYALIQSENDTVYEIIDFVTKQELTIYKHAVASVTKEVIVVAFMVNTTGHSNYREKVCNNSFVTYMLEEFFDEEIFINRDSKAAHDIPAANLITTIRYQD